MSNFNEVRARTKEIELNPSFDGCKRLILSVIKMLDSTIDSTNLDFFELFTDDGRKLAANASWFLSDTKVKDHKATYQICASNTLNIDFKLFGVQKMSKRVISWSQALTPNFEDEEFYQDLNLGIDFVVPKSFDRVAIVLSKNYVVRTLELHGSLTATFAEILNKWENLSSFENKNLVHATLWDSFDLSPINQKFYEGIQTHYTWLCQFLTQGEILDQNHAAQFSNRLIGRIIFSWFLDKKGLINNEMQYFRPDLFASSNEYYRNKLEVLFFEVLNKPILNRTNSDQRTPYLNGGLYESKAFDLQGDIKLDFPANYFDSLFSFFNSFNFTTDESTSQFQQVAIDPEMLGRIFENLLAEIVEETGEQARKAKGAFYTPREIVDYMCRESLRKYLLNKITPDPYLEQRLFQLIDAPDREFQDQDHNWRRDWKPYRESFLNALDEMKVLDPACGSGAFPMGMLQLLIKVYDRLEPRFDHHKAKLQILERNIFGVDIEPMAVEISRLRAWLSIVVDVDKESEGVKPLPNLDFKFVCANSLVPLSGDQGIMFGEDPELSGKLQAIREKFFDTEMEDKKIRLRKNYESLVTQEVSLFGESFRTTQLKTYRPFDADVSASFFDPKQMFGIDKFDIMIANPPYINSQMMVKNGNKDLRDFISSSYKFAKGNWDIYIAFFERGLQLLTADGVLVYITPDKWLAKRFGDSLRIGTLSRMESILIAGRKVFETANVDSIITVINTRESTLLKILNFEEGEVITKREVEKSLLEAPFVLDFLFSNHVDFLVRIEKECTTLESIARCETSVFINDAYRLKPLISELEGEFDPSVHLRVVNTGTISKYFDRWGLTKMTYLGNKYLHPVVDKLKFSEEFDNAYSSKSIKPKLIVKGLNLLDACFDEQGQVIPGIPTLVVQSESTDDLLFSMAIINSKFASFYLKERFPASSYNQGTTFTVDMINQLPIPSSLSKKQKKIIVDLVKKVLNAKNKDPKADTSDLQESLNRNVYELFNLNENEIKMIDHA